MSQVKTWVSDDKVYISIGTDDFSIIRRVDKEKFVKRYEEYTAVVPKESKSKACMTVRRNAIERCHACKVEKPITEFNCYGLFEAPCFDCCTDKNKQKFTLPVSLWREDFDSNNPGEEIGRSKADKDIKVIITDTRDGTCKEFTSMLSAGKYLGLHEGDCSRGRLLKKASEFQNVEFPNEVAKTPSRGERINQRTSKKVTPTKDEKKLEDEDEECPKIICEDFTDKDFEKELQRLKEWAGPDHWVSYSEN